MKEQIIGAVIGIIAITCFISLLGGTFLFFLWPVAIPSAFPAIVESGALAESLTWWQSVCLVWVFTILLKSSHSSSNKSD